jgi:hypothetical protein
MLPRAISHQTFIAINEVSLNMTSLKQINSLNEMVYVCNQQLNFLKSIPFDESYISNLIFPCSESLGNLTDRI